MLFASDLYTYCTFGAKVPQHYPLVRQRVLCVDESSPIAICANPKQTCSYPFFHSLKGILPYSQRI